MAAAEENNNLVHLKCIYDGEKKRMRITSPGYHPHANCMCPRNIRIEGRCYTIPSYDIMLRQGSAGTYFYILEKQRIKLVEIVPKKIYHDEDDPKECIICLTNEKNVVFVPCGHFCCCSECYPKLSDICPLCRAIINDAINKDKFDI